MAHSPVRRNNRELRLADYRAALFLWITASPFDFIVCLDASGDRSVPTADHLALADIHRKTVLTRAFDLADLARTKGKGRAEAYMIREAINEFRWDSVTKCNGRLYICNCERLHDAAGEVNFNRLDGPEARVDTRYYRISRRFFDDVLRHVEEQIDDADSHFFIEKVWGRAIQGDRRVSWWTEPPIIFGMNAT